MSADRTLLARLQRGLRMVTVPFPHLSGLVAATRIGVDERVPTMGVFASGRLVVNPAFAGRLNDADLMFVLAHEMLHLALRTHDRAKGAGRLEFNYAHDYIINDLLRAELGVAAIPANGLDLPGARARSAEEIVLEMRRQGREVPSRTRVWGGEPVPASERFPGSRAAGGAPSEQDGDVLSDELERELYPEDAHTQRTEAERVRALAAKALAMSEAVAALRGGRGLRPGAQSQSIAALRGLYRTPWRLALQRWIESVAPGERTFTRPSRRASDRRDVVLPGRRRCGWLLNVVLDTSGSMTDEIPRALGAIADFCDAAGVDQVRLLQCDARLVGDELLAPDGLARCEVKGYGGSDLSPALERLAEDPRTVAAVVLTDGEIDFPREALPYEVLWVLPAGARAGFAPPYGRVVTME